MCPKPATYPREMKCRRQKPTNSCREPSRGLSAARYVMQQPESGAVVPVARAGNRHIRNGSISSAGSGAHRDGGGCDGPTRLSGTVTHPRRSDRSWAIWGPARYLSGRLPRAVKPPGQHRASGQPVPVGAAGRTQARYRRRCSPAGSPGDVAAGADPRLGGPLRGVQPRPCPVGEDGPNSQDSLHRQGLPDGRTRRPDVPGPHPHGRGVPWTQTAWPNCPAPQRH